MERARECESEIYFADQCEYLRRTRLRFAPECELKGSYQEHNLQTAFVALRALGVQNTEYRVQTSYPKGTIISAIREGFAQVCTMTGLRGRWETLCERPLMICDTGHNSHGLQYVARQLKELANPHIWIVFGMVNDKDTDIVMRLLPSNVQSDKVQCTKDKVQCTKDNVQGTKEKVQYHYIFTTPNTQRARSAEEMLALWKESGVRSQDSAISIDNPQEAIRYAREHAAPEDCIFIGGSNYLVGEAIKMADLQKK